MASLFPDEYRQLVASMVAARKEAGMTQSDLARALGRPQSFVSKFEGGERRLDPVELVKIAQLLKADPFEVLSAATAVKRERRRTRRPKKQA